MMSQTYLWIAGTSYAVTAIITLLSLMDYVSGRDLSEGRVMFSLGLTVLVGFTTGVVFYAYQRVHEDD